MDNESTKCMYETYVSIILYTISYLLKWLRHTSFSVEDWSDNLTAGEDDEGEGTGKILIKGTLGMRSKCVASLMTAINGSFLNYIKKQASQLLIFTWK